MEHDRLLSANSIWLARQQTGRWRDLLWQSVLEEFAERDATAAEAVQAIIRAQPARALFGSSTRDAAQVWSHLDVQARIDWVWVCQFAHDIWIDDIRSAAGAGG